MLRNESKGVEYTFSNYDIKQIIIYYMTVLLAYSIVLVRLPNGGNRDYTTLLRDWKECQS